MKNNNIGYILLIVFAAILVFWSIWVMQVWGEEHELNMTWKEQQLQEKFDNINISDYTSYDKQMEKVQRTIDYLKYWGW